MSEPCLGLDVLPGTALAMMIAVVVARGELRALFHVVAGPVVLGAFYGSVARHDIAGFVGVCQSPHPLPRGFHSRTNVRAAGRLAFHSPLNSSSGQAETDLPRTFSRVPLQCSPMSLKMRAVEPLEYSPVAGTIASGRRSARYGVAPDQVDIRV